jgi:hypothetical protein
MTTKAAKSRRRPVKKVDTKSRPGPSPNLLDIADRLSDITAIIESVIAALDGVAERTNAPQALKLLLDLHALDPLQRQIKLLSGLDPNHED